jgi:hypothetical protein
MLVQNFNSKEVQKYRCSFLILMEKHGLRLFKNMAMRRIGRPLREELVGG